MSVRGLARACLAVDGTSYGSKMSGAARRTCCLLPRLASRGWSPVLFVAEAHAAPYAGLPGVRTVPVPVPRSPAPLRNALARRVLPPLLREHGATVFLTETPPPPSGLPWVLTVHDLRAFEAPQWTSWRRRAWARRVIPKAVASADAVVVPSESTAHGLHAFFPACTPHVAANGADHFPLATIPPPREDFLLAVGPWDRRRGLATLLAAHAQAHAERHLVLVGRPSLPRRAARARIECCEPDDVALPELYRRAAAVICPSHYEGFDLPLAEALAQGATVVASDLPVHHEVGGPAVRTYPAADPDALAVVLAEALANPTPPDVALARASAYPWRSTAVAMDKVLRAVTGLTP